MDERWATDNLVTRTALPLTTRRNRVVVNGNEHGDRCPRVVARGSVRLGLCHRLSGGLVVDEGAAIGIGGDEGLAGQVVDCSR